MAPVLAPLLDDPYAAVRRIAGEAAQTLPGPKLGPYDPFGPPPERAAAVRRLQATPARTLVGVPPLRRDDTPVYIAE